MDNRKGSKKPSIYYTLSCIIQESGEQCMFEELDTVVLAKDFEKYGLKRGDIGAVVHVYENGKALEVEFVNAEGKSIALLTLTPDDMRSIKRNEILHVRGFTTA